MEDLRAVIAALASWEGFPPVPFQPKKFNFPRNKIIRDREVETDSCQSAWFDRWKWLHYNVKTDCVFCHYCTTGVLTGKLKLTRKHNPLVTFGFCDWDNAVVCFQKHERTNLHRAALELIEGKIREMNDSDGDKRLSLSSLGSRISSVYSCQNRKVVKPTAATRLSDLPGNNLEGIDTSKFTMVNVVVVGDNGCGLTMLLDTVAELRTFYKRDTMAMVGNINFCKARSWELRKHQNHLYQNTSVVVMCFSIDNIASLRNIETKWIMEVRAFCSPAARILLVGNKLDVRTATMTGMHKVLIDRMVSKQDGLEVANRIGAYAYVECSAKEKIGIEDLLENVAEANFENIRALGNP